tara:strand:- start:2971 stop:3954 length:984 start_codon:yes stop_codon:yes gene_type:complete
MADQPKTGETANVKSNVKSKPTSDTLRTIEAVKKCFSDQDLIVSKTYPFIILFIIFYITTTRAQHLIDKSILVRCNQNISRHEYNDFISGFVYWVISFCIFIFIKFNGVDFINNFVIPTSGKDFVEKTVDGGKKVIKELLPWGRAKYVGQTLLTGFTSFLNIYFLYVLLMTLYKIIDKAIDLIKCKSEVCTRFTLCSKNNPSEARYYKSEDGECYDRDFNSLKPDPDNEDSNNSRPTFGDQDNTSTPETSRLNEDFAPRWLTDTIKWNTGLGLGMVLNIIGGLVVIGVYIFMGKDNNVFNGVLLVYGLYFIISNIIYITKGITPRGD